MLLAFVLFTGCFIFLRFHDHLDSSVLTMLLFARAEDGHLDVAVINLTVQASWGQYVQELLILGDDCLTF
jgi:hypothetical protein